jgi:hypothetical protein
MTWFPHHWNKGYEVTVVKLKSFFVNTLHHWIVVLHYLNMLNLWVKMSFDKHSSLYIPQGIMNEFNPNQLNHFPMNMWMQTGFMTKEGEIKDYNFLKLDSSNRGWTNCRVASFTNLIDSLLITSKIEQDKRIEQQENPLDLYSSKF